MKQRVTYLLPSGSSVDPSHIKVNDSGPDFPKPPGASEEWRLTLGLHELPNELRSALESCEEVHIRWISALNERLSSPLFARSPPGFHLFLTPKNPNKDAAFHYLARSLLGDGAVCSSSSEECQKLPILASHGTTSIAFQFYHDSPIDHATIGETVLKKVCTAESARSAWRSACQTQISRLKHARYVDIDLDVERRNLTLTAFWGAKDAKLASGNHESAKHYHKFGVDDRLEVGILETQEAKSPQLSLGGYLIVVGDGERPKPTRFSFDSRHHELPASSQITFTASFHQPTGLHPKLQINLPHRRLAPPKEACGLYAYLTIPSTLFIDPYQLSDRLFLDSQNLVALSSLSGEQDLEAPEWVIKRWGSVALFRLATPNAQNTSTSTEDDRTITIPLHLRYVDGPRSPTHASSEASINIPWPAVFWACESEESLKLANNPFDRTNLGYDGFFEPGTVFHHIPPAPKVTSTMLEIKAPVLSEKSGDLVQVGTLLAVALGFIWVCWRLLNAAKSKLKVHYQDRKSK